MYYSSGLLLDIAHVRLYLSLDLITPHVLLIPSYHSLLDVSFMSGMSMLTTQFSMHVYDSDLLIHVGLSLHAIGIHHTTRWGVLTPLDPYVQILKLGACGFSWLLIKDAQRKRGSSTDHLTPILPGPLLISRVFLL